MSLGYPWVSLVKPWVSLGKVGCHWVRLGSDILGLLGRCPVIGVAGLGPSERTGLAQSIGCPWAFLGVLPGTTLGYVFRPPILSVVSFVEGNKSLWFTTSLKANAVNIAMRYKLLSHPAMGNSGE